MSLLSTMTRIEAGSGSSATSFTSASVSPGADALVLLVVGTSSTNGTTPPSTISGGGMTTWDLVASIASGSVSRVSIYRAQQASPGSGTITIGFGATTIGGCAWAVYNIPGAQTGSNGAAAVVQSAVAASSATSITVSLAAYGSANNMGLGSTVHEANEAPTSFPSFTQQRSWQVAGSQAWDGAGMNAGSLTVTWASSTPNAAVALEVKEAVAAGTRPAPVARGQFGRRDSGIWTPV